MKGLLTATAVLGVLAIGGLPVLALNLAADETQPAPSAQVEGTPDDGMPPWGKAHGRDKAGKDAVKDKDARREAKDAWKADRLDDVEDGTPGWLKQSEVPPGWAKHHGGQRPHGWDMRVWAHCLADEAGNLREGEKLDPQTACGPRPAKPSKSSDKSSEKSSGKSSAKSKPTPAR